VQALETMASAPNQRLMILPVEASGIIGSLAGITEIAKSAFGGDGAAR
jgi:hypothetical protein